MAFDVHKNFAYSTVATAPSPADTGTSLVVQAGDGTKFPTPSFNATVWPAGSQPTTSNAEIVRVTAISTDTFTITRAQEGSTARSIVAGDQIAATITAKTLTDIENGTFTQYGTLARGTVENGLPAEVFETFRFPNTSTSYVQLMGVIPNDYASGDITISFYLVSHDDNNTRKMRRVLRVTGEEWASSPISDVSFDHTTSATYNLTIPAANVVVGKMINLGLYRYGDDPGDTGGRLALTLVRFSYTAKNNV